MHSGSWRIHNHYIRPTVFRDKVRSKYVLHVSRKEGAVRYSVCRGIENRIFDCLRNVFYTNDFCGLTSYKLSDGASTGIKVIDSFRSAQARKIPCYPVKFQSLGSICLIEGFGPYAESQVLHSLVYSVVATIKQGSLVRNAVVAFSVDYII